MRLCSPTRVRGWFALPRITLITRYPLGLFKAWVYLELSASCLVYPTPGKKNPPADAPDYTSSQKGDRGVGVDDFVGLRHYRPGDSPKHVNWKAVAREQALQTKMFGGDRSEQRWLDWHRLQGSTEHRLSQLCRGVLDACEEQEEFGLRLPDFELCPDRGQRHRHACLEALALFGTES